MQIWKSTEFSRYLPVKFVFFLKSSLFLTYSIVSVCLSANILLVCSYHVTHAFQSESTLYSFPNVKELLARGRHEIWSLSDCNWTRTHNHLVPKRTLNHLAKWLIVRLRTKWLWGRVQLQSLKHFAYRTIG